MATGPGIGQEMGAARDELRALPHEVRDRVTGEVRQETMIINMGPQHPSTHGVLRLLLELDGETVIRCKPIVGYLHTGIEKNTEFRTWVQGVAYVTRADYLSPFFNELAYCLSVERLLGIEAPPRAQVLRVLLCELNRIASHLVWVATGSLELGAVSMMLYGFRERELILDIFEAVTGLRMNHSFIRPGGVIMDLPPDGPRMIARFLDTMPARIDDYERILNENPIWLERNVGVGKLSAEDALALGQSGPVLRASGVDWDLRKNMPYLAYDDVEFHVPVYSNGDVYDRYKVHMDEMRESVRIVRQCLDRIDQMDGEPWVADDRKVVLPPRHELHTSMESLIHHFKLVTEGYIVPEGEVYVVIESPRGESGCYVVSDGGPRPWRVRFRAPSFAALQATATVVQDCLVADLIAVAGSLDPVMGDADR
jgi:NADH-quinone oxidoreductase subunit D